MSRKSMLLDMALDEISLVDKGANDGARVVIFKRSSDGAPSTMEDVRKYCGGMAAGCHMAVQPAVAQTLDELLATQEVQEHIGEFFNLVNTLQQSLLSINDDKTVDDKTKIGLMRRSIEEFKAAVEAELLTDSAESELEMSEKGGSNVTIEEIEKRLGELEIENKELKKRAETAEAKLSKADGEMCKMDDGTEGMMKGGVCVAKVEKAALPEEISKQLNAQAEQIRKSNEKIASMEDAALTAAYVEKAKTLGPLPIKAEELGPVLKIVAGSVSKEQYAVLDRVLKAAGGAFATLGNQLGSSAQGGGSDAYGKLSELAKSVQVEKGISFEKAFSEVRKTHRELWRQHRDEMRTAN